MGKIKNPMSANTDFAKKSRKAFTVSADPVLDNINN